MDETRTITDWLGDDYTVTITQDDNTSFSEIKDNLLKILFIFNLHNKISIEDILFNSMDLQGNLCPFCYVLDESPSLVELIEEWNAESLFKHKQHLIIDLSLII